MPITLTLTRSFTAHRYPEDEKITMLADTYEVEEVCDPSGRSNRLWLVRKGTKMGAALCYWEQYLGRGVQITRS